MDPVEFDSYESGTIRFVSNKFVCIEKGGFRPIRDGAKPDLEAASAN